MRRHWGAHARAKGTLDTAVGVIHKKGFLGVLVGLAAPDIPTGFAVDFTRAGTSILLPNAAYAQALSAVT